MALIRVLDRLEQWWGFLLEQRKFIFIVALQFEGLSYSIYHQAFSMIAKLQLELQFYLQLNKTMPLHFL